MKNLTKKLLFVILCLAMITSVTYAAEPVSEDAGSLTDAMITGTAKVLAETYSSRNPGLSKYDIVRMTGTVVVGEDEYELTEVFVKQGGASEVTLNTKYTYCPNHPLKFILYKYGNGKTGFDYNSSLYTIGGNGTPFDCELNAYGDAVGYKYDETITMKDKSLSQVTLVSTARSRIPPTDTYIRKVVINFTPGPCMQPDA